MEKPRVAVLDDYDGSISKLDCWDRARGELDIAFYPRPIADADLAKVDALVTVRERTIVTEELLSRAPRVKHLALTGRLSGQADLDALKRRKIAVSFTDGSGSAAAEHTIALLLGAARGLTPRHAEMVRGGWQIGPSVSLSGKTLGVLGLGRIGTKVAQFGKLLDMKVVSWGPTPDQGRSEKLGISRLELHDVLKQSDFVTICLRLSDKTRGLLRAPELALLRDGALLVNTARAEIVEKSALYSALESGRISAALDVFHEEPLPPGDPLRGFGNVLLSPHMGYATLEVYRTFFSQVVENLLAWKNGRPYKNALEVSP